MLKGRWYVEKVIRVFELKPSFHTVSLQCVCVLCLNIDCFILKCRFDNDFLCI